MKPLFLILSSVLLISGSIIAQCGNLTFTTQQEIDNFSVNYPGCTEVNILIIEEATSGEILNLDSLIHINSFGNVYIQSNDVLTSLEGLSNLTGGLWNLTISDNNALVNLNGLNNLTHVDNMLTISNNNSLEDIEGLENLVSAGAGLHILNNPSLISLNGFTSIYGVASYGGEFDDGLQIVNNDALTNLDGLETLTGAGRLVISDNENLQNIDALINMTNMCNSWYAARVNISNNSSLQSILGISNLELSPTISCNYPQELYISGNNQLSTCEAKLLCNLFHPASPFTGGYVGDNAPGCNSKEEINEACEVICFYSTIVLSTQGEIDSFPVNYPYCSEICGDLTIKEEVPNSITNLDSLLFINSILGELTIEENNSLSSLSGLENINTIKSLRLQSNSSLIDLSGLSNITSFEKVWIIENSGLNSLVGLENLVSVEELLFIGYNNGLASLTGLENLVKVGDLRIYGNDNISALTGLENLTTIYNNFWIKNNSSLINLSGLDSLNSIGSLLRIHENTSLSDLSSLENISFIGDEIKVFNNVGLSTCESTFICNYLGAGNPATIYGNAPGCNTIEEIQFSCGYIGNIQHPLFYDINENGVLDTGEPYYPPASVTIDPGAYISFANATNGGLYYLPFSSNDDYIVTYNQINTPSWELTTGTSSYTVSIDSINLTDTIYFGLRPTVSISDIASTIGSGNFRCNEYVTFNLYAENQGTTVTEGTLWFEADEEIIDAVFIDTPDTLVAPNLYGWHFSSFFPGYVFQKQIKLLMPGPLDFPLGETLNFISEVSYSDISGVYLSEQNLYTNIMTCSFDPNDKLVNPIYPQNYALIEEDLVYTIRFQNTGNAEAYDVVIRDTLNEHLDPTTFLVIASSHEEVLSTTMESNQFLEFEFRDINLPDSTSNFELSQGYVIYRIRANENIPVGTEINNTASIYFDFNPAVITNTTKNIMIDSFYVGLDLDQDGYLYQDDCDDTNASVNPDATEVPYNGLDDDCNPLTLDDDLDEDGFGVADDCDDTDPAINPDAIEIVNNDIDENCDEYFAQDADNDGFWDDVDCDDDNPAINPDVTEIIYNGLDDDCNPLTLDDDLDEDGYNLVDDCDDTDATINPSATEVPYNGIDEDCNELTLDDDLDEDGFGIVDDCDDTNPGINPAATEIPDNGIDEDCLDGDLITISTNEIEKQRPQIFPNPTTGKLNIELPHFTSASLIIKDYSGKTILAQNLEATNSINLATLPSGVYIVLIQTEGQVWTERVVKM